MGNSSNASNVSPLKFENPLSNVGSYKAALNYKGTVQRIKTIHTSTVKVSYHVFAVVSIAATGKRYSECLRHSSC